MPSVYVIRPGSNLEHLSRFESDSIASCGGKSQNDKQRQAFRAINEGDLLICATVAGVDKAGIRIWGYGRATENWPGGTDREERGGHNYWVGVTWTRLSEKAYTIKPDNHDHYADDLRRSVTNPPSAKNAGTATQESFNELATSWTADEILGHLNGLSEDEWVEQSDAKKAWTKAGKNPEPSIEQPSQGRGSPLSTSRHGTSDLSILIGNTRTPRCLIFEGVPGTGKTFAIKPLQSEEGRSLYGAVGDGDFAITLHPATAYEDFVEGLRPAAAPGVSKNSPDPENTVQIVVRGAKIEGEASSYEWTPRDIRRPFFHAPEGPASGATFSVSDGFFVRCCRAAVLAPEKWFIVLLDEINRCNIPKVFGDLLTTIEQSKRARWVTITEGGETKQGWDLTNAQTVTLPYSGRTFFVPDNIIVIGTMNTTDRSVAPMDAALRRRFAFMRVWPFGFGPDDGNSNADTILAKLSAGDLAPHLRPSVELWLSINKRLHDFGDDALLGHSYLFALKDDLALAADDEEREATTIFHWNHYIFPQVIDIIQSNDLESKMFGSQKDDKDGKVLLPQVSDNKTGLYKEYRPGLTVEGTRRGEGMLRTLTLRLTKATVAGE